ncbi:AtpZ/AtpI family protein [Salinactinospora qingdaonensis]|uniref:F0F1-ATPase subunit Ca2+/Mg2+ transporter n=1 Tax=Salinactinospora qingdaonensis TaxID=702744 RepID=A0ABP7FPB1_9ACTN
MSDRQGAARNSGERNVDPASVIAYLLAGMAVWGGLGWLADQALDFQALFLPIGVLLGLALAVYLIYVQFIRS